MAKKICDRCSQEIGFQGFNRHYNACDGKGLRKGRHGNRTLGGQLGHVGWNRGVILGKSEKISIGLNAMYAKQKVKDLEQWKLGNLIPKHAKVKRLLIFEKGKRCQKCGWAETNPYSKTIPIELEHINGDCYDFAYENCCLLCPNCHSLTPTFRGLNRGKGQGRNFYKLVSRWAKEQDITGVWGSSRKVEQILGR